MFCSNFHFEWTPHKQHRKLFWNLIYFQLFYFVRIVLPIYRVFLYVYALAVSIPSRKDTSVMRLVWQWCSQCTTYITENKKKNMNRIVFQIVSMAYIGREYSKKNIPFKLHVIHFCLSTRLNWRELDDFRQILQIMNVYVGNLQLGSSHCETNTNQIFKTIQNRRYDNFIKLTRWNILTLSSSLLIMPYFRCFSLICIKAIKWSKYIHSSQLVR